MAMTQEQRTEHIRRNQLMTTFEDVCKGLFMQYHEGLITDEEAVRKIIHNGAWILDQV